MWLPRASKLSSEDVTIFEYIKPEVFFPRMRSKGSRFTLGGLGGVEAVFAKRCATVRNCSQPFAGDRVRPVWQCLWRVLQKGSLLEVSSVA